MGMIFLLSYKPEGFYIKPTNFDVNCVLCEFWTSIPKQHFLLLSLTKS